VIKIVGTQMTKSMLFILNVSVLLTIGLFLNQLYIYIYIYIYESILNYILGGEG